MSALFFKKNQPKSVPEKEPKGKKPEKEMDTVVLAKGTARGLNIHVIKHPHYSEKTSLLEQQNKYVFRVNPSVNKTQIKQAIEKMYNVSVGKLNIINYPAKTRKYRGRVLSQPSRWAKAIVTLKKGFKINLGSQ